jgi:tRNA(Leu) C34 or U34 (ribose-2'-O)-methylase TrmL
MIHLAFLSPEIPGNVGTLLRLVRCWSSLLHIIHPLGFIWSDKHLRRAALDYQDPDYACHHESWSLFSQWVRTKPLTHRHISVFDASKSVQDDATPLHKQHMFCASSLWHPRQTESSHGLSSPIAPHHTTPGQALGQGLNQEASFSFQAPGQASDHKAPSIAMLGQGPGQATPPQTTHHTLDQSSPLGVHTSDQEKSLGHAESSHGLDAQWNERNGVSCAPNLCTNTALQNLDTSLHGQEHHPRRIIALVVDFQACPYLNFTFRSNDILVLGCESLGLPKEVQAMCDACITIPMAPDTRSLNVAIAGSIVFAEALRQTHRLGL